MKLSVAKPHDTSGQSDAWQRYYKWFVIHQQQISFVETPIQLRLRAAWYTQTEFETYQINRRIGVLALVAVAPAAAAQTICQILHSAINYSNNAQDYPKIGRNSCIHFSTICGCHCYCKTIDGLITKWNWRDPRYTVERTNKFEWQQKIYLEFWNCIKPVQKVHRSNKDCHIEIIFVFSWHMHTSSDSKSHNRLQTIRLAIIRSTPGTRESQIKLSSDEKKAPLKVSRP